MKETTFSAPTVLRLLGIILLVSVVTIYAGLIQFATWRRRKQQQAMIITMLEAKTNKNDTVSAPQTIVSHAMIKSKMLQHLDITTTASTNSKQRRLSSPSSNGDRMLKSSTLRPSLQTNDPPSDEEQHLDKNVNISSHQSFVEGTNTNTNTNKNVLSVEERIHSWPSDEKGEAATTTTNYHPSSHHPWCGGGSIIMDSWDMICSSTTTTPSTTSAFTLSPPLHTGTNTPTASTRPWMILKP